jgi:hypothetical protein
MIGSCRTRSKAIRGSAFFRLTSQILNLDKNDAYPKEKSIRRFMDQVRQRTKRTAPLKTKELTEELNPLLR